MKKIGLAMLALALGSGIFFASTRDKSEEWVMLSRFFEVEDIYPAMTGPLDQRFNLQLSRKPGELIWMNGFSAKVIGAADEPKPQEMVCHAAVWMECLPQEYRALWGEEAYGSGRFFTLAQGQTEMNLPEGFAIPAPASQTIMLTTQLLNEWDENKGEVVRHKSKINFKFHSEMKETPTPLALFEATSLVYLSKEDAEATNQPHAAMVPAEGGDGVDEQGRRWSAHWLVPKGLHEYRSPVELGLPYDTTAHYIAIHVHRFAKSCALVDKTTGEVVFEAKAHHKNGRLAKVDNYSSKVGIPVYKDHKYELVSVYDNPSDVPQGAMAIAFVYVEDKFFKMPDLSQLVPPVPIVGLNREAFCAAPNMEDDGSGGHEAATSGASTPQKP